MLQSQEQCTTLFPLQADPELSVIVTRGQYAAGNMTLNITQVPFDVSVGNSMDAFSPQHHILSQTCEDTGVWM